MSTGSYLDRFLDPMTDVLTPDMAQSIVELRADSDLVAEVELLRHKANQGTLTSDEQAAYRDIVDAIDLISIVQSKARRVLTRSKS